MKPKCSKILDKLTVLPQERERRFTQIFQQSHNLSLTSLEIRAEMPEGEETILLVEDDISVREVARRVLQRLGYTLLEAQDGQEALRLLAHYSGPIDLLLIDLILPRMNGKDLAEKALQFLPGLKILFMSGYTDETITQHVDPTPHVAFLQKPFSPVVLARKVRAVLDN
jgi:CheY-like chemotaxis protein